ncbi:MAG TPA: metal-dependent transcriptional regulator [Phycisphaerae bacterium]|nr:metal-dependent transcriptional regulator [Phycisphaerae bacterium]
METWKEFDANIVTHSAAHHLMAIADLLAKLGYARVSDVARALNITRGSVSISLQPLKKAGLVVQDENRHLGLSARGQALVEAIKAKRRIVERFLAGVLGVDSVQAEIDACKFEHLLSDESARRLVSFLRFFDSDQRRARHFLEAWRSFDQECAHEPHECSTCEEGCMAEALENRGPARGGSR